MTNSEIDGLSVAGRAIDDAVADALGWQWCNAVEPRVGKEYVPPEEINGRRKVTAPPAKLLQYKMKRAWMPFWGTDIGLAFGLLLDLPEVRICTTKLGQVYVSAWEDAVSGWQTIAADPKSDAASIMCHAWLKLKNRKGE